MVNLNKFGLGLLAGLVAGVVAGMLARVAMRVVALVIGIPPSSSVDGTLAILIIGAILGLLFGLVFAAVRRFVPISELWKGLIYGIILLLFFVIPPFLSPEGEFSLVSPEIGLIIFGPIPIVYGILLAVALRYLEGRYSVDSGRRVGVVWVALFGLTLVLALAGMTSLMETFVSFPPAVGDAYRGLGMTFQSAHDLHTILALAYALGYSGLVALIFWRGSDVWMAKFASLALLIFAAAFFNTGVILSGVMDTLPMVQVVPGLVRALGLASLLILFYTFPDGRFVPGWTRLLAMIWCAWLLVWFLDLFPGSLLDPDTWPEPLLLVTVLGGLGSGVLAQFIRYWRTSEPARRRQTRWVMVAFLGAVLGFGLLWVFSLISPDLRVAKIPMPLAMFTFVLYLVPWLLIPLAMVLSMLRHRLWDVELV